MKDDRFVTYNIDRMNAINDAPLQRDSESRVEWFFDMCAQVSLARQEGLLTDAEAHEKIEQLWTQIQPLPISREAKRAQRKAKFAQSRTAHEALAAMAENARELGLSYDEESK